MTPPVAESAALWPTALAIAVSASAITFLISPWLLRRLPEPPETNTADKIAYRDLVTPQFQRCAGALSGALIATTLPFQSVPTWPAWTAFGTIAGFLTTVDIRTTWLPTPAIRVGWLLMTAALLSGIFLGLTADDIGRALLSAVAVGTFFLVIWFLGRGDFGFGDVRFAIMIGIATGATSWFQTAAAITIGVLIGALHAICQLTLRRTGNFPYTPALTIGAVIAVIAF